MKMATYGSSDVDLDVLVTEFMRDAGDLAHRAVSHDKEQKYEIARYFYQESVSLLERAKQGMKEIIADDETNNPSFWQGKLSIATNKLEEYQRRIDEIDLLILEEISKEQKAASKKLKPVWELLFDRAKFLINQALDIEKDCPNDEEAYNLYTEAIQICLEAKASCKDTSLSSQITTLASQALDRAEKIKLTLKPTSKQLSTNQDENSAVCSWPVSASSSAQIANTPRDSDDAVKLKSAHALDLNTKLSGRQLYSEDEKKVLLRTSRINNVEYLPFMRIDLQEKFASPLPFTDKDGLLALSPKQKKNFLKWARPDELWPNPKLIQRIDCFSVRQTIVSDCSFVASLSVSGLYEKRFNKKLITSIIYPQNREGIPVYNPCGKYMVKLMVNGVLRKVIIDDQLPVGRHSELLCSYSSNKGELWVSLLEKAYMKVMGGYDFPGSNSSIDLHALTGWIPERVAIHSKETTFEKDKMFIKLRDRLANGDVLVTVATGDMTEREAERAGLVPTHAYAVLDIKEVKGVRLLLLKNPWSHLRWKGNYSELDTVHWTDEMKQLLHYDPNCASMFDNGVFWIDYDSICRFFDVFYMSWNPALFPFTYCTHSTWLAGVGPAKDVYNVGENPQYKLEVKPTNPSGGAVWVLLTRHITEVEDFKENREYITVVVYENDGKRLYYPYEPPPVIDGIRINSPHYLCKIRVEGSQARKYTLVISQYEKMHSIHYTLRAYSSCPFQLNQLIDDLKYQKKVTGEWKGITAGGCLNNVETYKYNPCYRIALQGRTNSKILIELKGPKKFHVGFDILCSNVMDPKAPGFFNKKSSGPYRPGFVILELDNVPCGVYNLIPSTFKSGDEGPFFLNIKCSCDFSLTLLPPLNK